jgi:hypothetical protein
MYEEEIISELCTLEHSGPFSVVVADQLSQYSHCQFF